MSAEQVLSDGACVDSCEGDRVADNGACADSCEGDRVADNGVCRDPNQSECSAGGEVLSEGACRPPNDAGECAAGSVVENGVCATGCLGSRTPDSDGVCREPARGASSSNINDDETPPNPPPPAELVEGEIRIPPLPEPAPSDSRDYRTAEFNSQRGLAMIRADEAYRRGYFGQGVTVAVLDSGVARHPELEESLLPGYNVVANNADTVDRDGHGTFVAGVIAAAIGGDDNGMHGVAPSASILPLKLEDERGNLTGSSSEAIREGARRGAVVFNNSYVLLDKFIVRIDAPPGHRLAAAAGLTLYAELPLMMTAWNRSQTRLAAALDAAVGDADAAYVWAAGNQEWRAGNRSFIACEYVPGAEEQCSAGTRAFAMSPAEFLQYAYDLDEGRPLSEAGLPVNSAGFYAEIPLMFEDLQGRWLAVGSTNEDGNSSQFSNGCGLSKYWCLTAPGEGIRSISPAGPYVFRQGTSFSAPHVSGALALLKSRFPAMPMEAVRAILLVSAEDLGDPGVDDVFGWGRLDVGSAATLQSEMTIRVVPAGGIPIFELPPPNPPNLEYDRTAEFERQYGLARIGADAAYWRGYFGQGVTVAVVDTGLLTSHVEISANVVAGEDFGESLTVMTDPIAEPFNSGGHGTFVAGIIAAATGGLSVHGVAPSASIMPMKFSDRFGILSGDPIAAIATAAARGAHVVNNSWSSSNPMIGEYGGTMYYASTPLIGAFHRCSSGIPGSCPVPDIADTLTAALQDRESVLVWAAGNAGWNAENGRVRLCPDIQRRLEYRGCPSPVYVSPEEFIRGFTPRSEVYRATVSITRADDGATTSFVRSVATHPLFVGADLASLPNITTTSPGMYARAPIENPDLQDNWLVAVATDQSDVIDPFSNGCGDAKFWCLAAPGVSVPGLAGTSDNATVAFSDASAAAPHVSGALALLKSRLPDMPMDVVRAVLLYTADDLGDPGVDDIYGWGLVNMERAITLQGQFGIVPSENGLLAPAETLATAGVNLQSARVRLPSALSHVGAGLARVSVAVGGIGNAHYNAPLSDFVEVRESPAEIAHTAAAADMLSTDERRFQAGNLFAAADAKSGQFQYAGALVDAGPLGAWSFRSDFCDDCIASVWPEWQAADAAKQAARQAAFQGYGAMEPALGGFEIMPSSLPFFARESGEASFMASMQGEGLRPFAAAGEGDAPYRQYGLRWRKSLVGGLGLLAEASEVRESETFWGADFGSLGRASAQTRQARLFAGGDLNEEWRGFGGYEASFGAAEADGGALLREVSGMRSSEWSAGLERRDVFSWGDALRARVSWRRVSGGEAVISHAVADEEECDFTCAFYGSLGDTPEYLVAGEQELESRESRVSLSSSASWSVALGYAFRLSKKSTASLGASHASPGSGGTTAFSAAIQAEF